MRILVLMLAALLLLGGCAALQWSRPGATETEFHQDRFACEKDALAMYPVPQAAPVQNSGYNTQCTGYGNQMNCTSRPVAGGYSAQAALSQAQLNAQTQRNIAMETCMRTKGWRRG
ncbi:MAG: hypothetical protein QM599_00095 [Pseudoxanthomonas sp.]